MTLFKTDIFYRGSFFLLSLATQQLLKADTNCRGMTHSKHPLPARQIVTSVKTAVKLQPQPRVSAGLVWTVQERQLKVKPTSPHKFPESITDRTWFKHCADDRNIKSGGPASAGSSVRPLDAQKEAGRHKHQHLHLTDKQLTVSLISFHVLAICGWFICGISEVRRWGRASWSTGRPCFLPFPSNQIHLPMRATNPFMCTIVRRGHHVSYFVLVHVLTAPPYLPSPLIQSNRKYILHPGI